MRCYHKTSINRFKNMKFYLGIDLKTDFQLSERSRRRTSIKIDLLCVHVSIIRSWVLICHIILFSKWYWKWRRTFLSFLTYLIILYVKSHICLFKFKILVHKEQHNAVLLNKSTKYLPWTLNSLGTPLMLSGIPFWQPRFSSCTPGNGNSERETEKKRWCQFSL